MIAYTYWWDLFMLCFCWWLDTSFYVSHIFSVHTNTYNNYKINTTTVIKFNVIYYMDMLSKNAIENPKHFLPQINAYKYNGLITNMVCEKVLCARETSFFFHALPAGFPDSSLTVSEWQVVPIPGWKISIAKIERAFTSSGIPTGG